MSLPRIAVTLGDVAGIGPEVIVRAWNYASLHTICRPVVIGHPEILRRTLRQIGSGARVVEIAAPEEAEPRINSIPCLPAGGNGVLDVELGRVEPRAGDAAYQYLVRAAKLALMGRVDAVTTAPLNKEALHAAGHHYPGHTEILAELAGISDFAMMLYLSRSAFALPGATRENEPRPGPRADVTDGFGVAHVTLHNALADVPRLVTVDGIYSKIRLAESFLKEIGAPQRRVAVAALNPHAGENSLFGDEEAALLSPAIGRAIDAGIDVTGPIPADTLFLRAAQGEFDAVVAMYHDQGHVAVKLLGFHRAVNVTLGLPLIRTSVAHGTAFDIAGQGVAEADGMVEALRVAATLASNNADGSRPSTESKTDGSIVTEG